MAKGVVRFSSIGQYRDIITSVAKIASLHNVPLPVLHFRGLVKLHGTNAAIVYDPTKKTELNDGIMIQSRNNVYGPMSRSNDQGKEAGHMGFNEFAHRPEIVALVEYIYKCCITTENLITSSNTSLGSKVLAATSSTQVSSEQEQQKSTVEDCPIFDPNMHRYELKRGRVQQTWYRSRPDATGVFKWVLSSPSQNEQQQEQTQQQGQTQQQEQQEQQQQEQQPKMKMIIYGEWAGKGIMKNVAISELDKGFYIFGILLSPIQNNKERSLKDDDTKELDEADDETIDLDTPPVQGDIWYDIANIRLPENAAKVNFFNLTDFEYWELDIDFKDPKAVQNRIVEITNQVEKLCPVGHALGVSGTGEGVVWQTEWKGYRLLFKVKGTKHSVSKVKTLASIDAEEHASIQSFLEYAVTDNRVDQAIHEVGLKKGSVLKMSDMGDLIRWMSNDILKEESDVLKKSNLDWNKVTKHIYSKARNLFTAKLTQA